MKITRLAIPYLLGCIVFISTIKTALVYSYYFVNPDNFIALFCENTDKPELECDGKCYLKKVSLNQLETTQNDNLPKVNIDLENILLYVDTLADWQLTSLETTQKKASFFYQNLYTSEVSFAIFHPPNHRFNSII
ncbi:hypothetical protein KORDIASMS9_02051 [Kordia sp. SMS9]|uniref:hypothetical protein n=1 Tax=Kordia sp. SMS9 TaxID=2282170 RepID=UPI000E0DD6CD|nr:hypothetical protein [Kordia sp. SMS9]AXG69823.1 hypothetical protein KORDIASMS9_02051 [Kordia sp. SMS9]